MNELKIYTNNKRGYYEDVYEIDTDVEFDLDDFKALVEINYELPHFEFYDLKRLVKQAGNDLRTIFTYQMKLGHFVD